MGSIYSELRPTRRFTTTLAGNLPQANVLLKFSLNMDSQHFIQAQMPSSHWMAFVIPFNNVFLHLGLHDIQPKVHLLFSQLLP